MRPMFMFIVPFRVEEIAKKKGVSMAQIATAWVMAKDGKNLLLLARKCPELIPVHVGVTAPIVGTTSLKNLEDLIGMST